VADVMPLFPLGTVLFPGSALPLQVFEPRYRQLVEDLLVRPAPRLFGVVAIREGHEVGSESIRSLYDVGCTAEVAQLGQADDGRYLLMNVGRGRFRLLELDRSRAYLQARVEMLDEPTGAATDPTLRQVREAFVSYRDLVNSPVPLPGDDDPTKLSYAVAGGLAVSLPERQGLLEATDSAQRLAAELALLSRELKLMRGLRTMPLPQPPLRPGSQN
jgi:Lon protease-like protein